MTEPQSDQRALIAGLREAMERPDGSGLWVRDGKLWTIAMKGNGAWYWDVESEWWKGGLPLCDVPHGGWHKIANACPELLDAADRGLEAQPAIDPPWLRDRIKLEVNSALISADVARSELEAQLAAVEAERDRLRGLLTYVYGVTGVIDNGHCVFCRRARLWTAAGANNPPLPCENPDCVTHEIDAKLAASPNQKAKVHGE
jgi:hypothetical protein